MNSECGDAQEQEEAHSDDDDNAKETNLLSLKSDSGEATATLTEQVAAVTDNASASGALPSDPAPGGDASQTRARGAGQM